METSAIDRHMFLKDLKDRVDSLYKASEAEVQAELSEAMEEGRGSLVSNLFGLEAGEYKQGMSRKKDVISYNLLDQGDYIGWMRDNADAVESFMVANAPEFGEWWFNVTGEVPEGISRVMYTQPPMPTKPKIYRFKPEVVEAKMRESGLMDGIGQFLLGDGDDA